MTETSHPLTPRKLTHHQARMEHLVFWSRKSVAERLAASRALTKRMYLLRGIDLDELNLDLTPRRVPRRPLRDLADVEELSLIPEDD